MTRQFYVRNISLKHLIIAGIILLGVGGFCLWYRYLSLEPSDVSPAWSPDGQHLAFSCHRRQRDREWKFLQEYQGPYSGNDSLDWYELCVLDIESGDMMQLTRNTHYDGVPTWSPDGLHIAYMSKTMDQHSYDIKLLTLNSLTTTTLIAGNEKTGYPLLWSPTEPQLAFVSSWDNSPYRDLYLFEIDTGETQQLTSIYKAHEFAWSPDGKYIACTGGEYMETEIFIISVESGTTSQITFDKGYKASPAWSPNGQFIAFTAGERFEQIYIVNISTLETTSLSTEATSAHLPVWSPDGNHIAYLCHSKFIEIKALNQSMETRSYEIPDDVVLDLQWSPDGKYLTSNQYADWNRDGWSEPKILLLDIEQGILRPSYTPFPWQFLSNAVNP